MSVINTNKAAMFAQTALKANESKLSVAMQQLSTAKRINSAKDDAAGLSISTRMTQWVRGLDMAVRNSNDAISMIQTAEGATNEITNMMQRMRELAVQAVNDTNTSMDREYIDLEFQQLKQQIVAIANQTEWNGFPILRGTVGEPIAPIPMLKVTSQNLSSKLLINQTPATTIAGADSGEVESFSFVGRVSNGGAFTVDGVPVATLLNDAGAAIADKVKTALEASTSFGPTSGRVVASAAGVVTITYPAKDGYKAAVNIDPTTTGIGAVVSAITRSAITQVTPQFSNGGQYLKTGTLNVSTDALGNLLTTTFQTSRGETVMMTGVINAINGTISFSRAAGLNSTIISENLVLSLKDVSSNPVNISTRATQLRLDIEGGIPALRTGDLRINDIDIGPSIASDDLLSPPENASGSAIAKATAINKKTSDSIGILSEIQTVNFSGTPTIPSNITVGAIPVLLTAAENTAAAATAKIVSTLSASAQYGTISGRAINYTPGASSFQITYTPNEGDVAAIPIVTTGSNLTSYVDEAQKYTPLSLGTGVHAKVNTNIYTGQAMQSNAAIAGTIFINGYATPDIKTTINSPQKTCDDVVKSINAMTYKTGVKAINTGSDLKGVTLVAEDGRNIQVALQSSSGNDFFAEQIGLRTGVQSSTISLESKIPARVVLSSSLLGDISRAGLTADNFTSNQAAYNTLNRASVAYNQPQLNSINLGGSWTAGADTVSVNINGTTFNYVTNANDTPQIVRLNLIASINANQTLGVTATSGRTTGEILLTANKEGIPFTLITSKNSLTGTISNAAIVENKSSPAKVLKEKDLRINEIDIRASLSSDDTLSNTVAASSNPAASAIAIAAAINSSLQTTGVKALANSSSSVGTLTDLTATGEQHLYINGSDIKIIFTAGDAAEIRRQKILDAINSLSTKIGVKAIKNLKDSGITLNSDGRNLSVWFDSNIQDLSAASFGLDKGDAVAQISQIKLGGTIDATSTASVTINGTAIAVGPAAGATATAFAISMRNAVNAAGLRNLTAAIDANDNTIVKISSTVAGSPFDIRGATLGVTAGTLEIGEIKANSIGSNDITGIRGATGNSNQAKTVYGSVKLIGITDDISKLPDVSDIVSRSNLFISKPFNISTGLSGFSSNSNFLNLGFLEGGFGGRASHDMDGPQVGRIAFQVGENAKQLVTIDIADFGKNGDITGLITADVDKSLSQRNARVHTREGASTALNMLDICLEKIDAARATMGAMINRLDHIIDNDTNMSQNMSASRSRIEDTDYASATSEMAKAQIIQQAGTAILAQANTNQQYVLKLLGG